MDLLTQNRVSAADVAFTEAFRLARMEQGEMPPAIYQGLARVRLAQGDARQARRFLDTAIELGTKGANRTPLWYLYQAHGRTLEALGDLPGALADYRRAIELARLWRSGVLPATWMQTATDAGVSSLSADLVAVALRLGTERSDLAGEAFIEVEESKANSLRLLMLTGSRIPQGRKVEYAELRARLSDALFRSMQTGVTLESPEVRELRARLAVLESEATSSAGLDQPGERQAVRSSLARCSQPPGSQPGSAQLSRR